MTAEPALGSEVSSSLGLSQLQHPAASVLASAPSWSCAPVVALALQPEHRFGLDQPFAGSPPRWSETAGSSAGAEMSYPGHSVAAARFGHTAIAAHAANAAYAEIAAPVGAVGTRVVVGYRFSGAV